MSDSSLKITAEPRRITGINTIGLFTLAKRETNRFLKVYLQTILTPVINVLLFYAVFALAFGGIGREMGGIPFLDFLAPGLVMNVMVQNAFTNTSSSISIAKIQGSIVDVLMPPLSSNELMVGFILGGLARGLVVGLCSVVALTFFMSLEIHSVVMVLSFAVLASLFMAILGIIAGIIANKFDHLAAFTSFFITPMTFLSGTFYSIHELPAFWENLALYNPFFYIIDGFRSGFINYQDGDVLFGLFYLMVLNIVFYLVAYWMLRKGYRIKS